MASYIGSAGTQLPFPSALYPVQIGNVPSIAATNRLTLPPGGDMLVPPGKFWIVPGVVSQVQLADPVLTNNTITTMWLPYAASILNEPLLVDSDGTNYRVTNPTGQCIGAVVTASGGGYTSNPTVTATPVGSTWQAVIGPGISAITINTAGSGTGYTIPPLVNIAAPAAPGVQATAISTINSAGAVISVTIINAGAGYVAGTPPSVVFAAQNSDVNFFPPSGTSTTAIKTALGTAVTSFVGSVMAVLVTNEGTNAIVGNNPPALAITGGGGTGAAATAIPALAITNITVVTGGSGYPAGVSILTAGGSISAQTSGQTAGGTANPLIGTGLLVPRQAQISAVAGSGSGVQVGTVVDPGMFTAVPFAYAVPNNVAANSQSSAPVIAVFSLSMGGVNDTILMQPW